MKKIAFIFVMLITVLIMACPPGAQNDPGTDKDITSFSFLNVNNDTLTSDVTGRIENGNIIRVNVPSGTDLTDLKATFITNGASVSIGEVIQISGTTANDFSGDVIFTVTAEDDSTKTYTVWVLTTVVDNSALADMVANEEDLTRLDTSLITNMSGLFSYNDNFNQDISRWDVSNVTDMSQMFYSAPSFNQDISRWDVSGVTDMSDMFYGAEGFNQDIGGWDVGLVANMSSMFNCAVRFNQDIGAWNVSNVTNMSTMFCMASAFNQDIGNWNVSKVVDMSYMFSNAAAFNQDLTSWALHISQSIAHGLFSNGTAILQQSYHPYSSWYES